PVDVGLMEARRFLIGQTVNDRLGQRHVQCLADSSVLAADWSFLSVGSVGSAVASAETTVSDLPPRILYFALACAVILKNVEMRISTVSEPSASICPSSR